MSDVRQQILDGQRSWSASEFGGDHDVFFSEVVTPLRALKAKGVFDALNEIKFAIDGDMRITGVEIIGAVDYNRL